MGRTIRRHATGTHGRWGTTHRIGCERLESRRLLSIDFLPGQVLGNVQSASVVEASGLVASRRNDGVLWVHNDSGDTARVFAMNTTGQHLGIYNVTGAGAVDWEDIATGPGPATGVDYLYLADIGDNGASRSTIQVYRVAEPTVDPQQAPVNINLSGAATLTLAYPDGARNAEALVVDPQNGDLYVITKETNARIYRASYPQSTSSTTTMTYMGQLAYGGVNGANISPDGMEILTKTLTSVRLHVRTPGGNVWDALTSAATVLPYTVETQGEAVTFDRRGEGYFTTSEGANQPLYYYDRVGQSESTLDFAMLGDYGFDGAAEASVAALVNSWTPDFVTTVGDNNYDLGAASTIDANIGKHYQQYIGKYTGAYGSGSPTNRFFPSPGNHDWETTNMQPYIDYFSLLGNERYYDFRQGPVHFFMVDSDSREPDGISPASAQAQWLKGALARSTAPFQVVMMHHSAFSSSSGHGSTPLLEWPYEQWGADAVISGHDHTYERLNIEGIPYFVNGLGGRSLYGWGTTVSGSQVQYNADYGAMRVSATNDAMTFQFYSVAGGGTLIDSYTINRPADSASLVAASDPWKFLDNGSNQGTAWQSPSFNDSTWVTGSAQLGYGDGDESTTVSYGPDSANKYITTYFRKSFNVADPSDFTSFNLDLLRDDGAVVYLNGTEIGRTNLPAGTITYTTLAPAAIGGTDENRWVSFAVSPSLIQTGTNALAVEMHQNAGSSSDLSFNLHLKGVLNAPPTSNAGGPYSVAEGNSLVLTASGVDPESDLLTFTWDVNGDGVFTDATGINPTLNWSQLEALGINDGPTFRSVRVKVDDGHNAPVPSAATTLTVSNTAPAASITAAAVTNRGTTENITLIATDPSSVDQAANFTFAIDWDGNGSTDQTVVGPSGSLVAHAYAIHGVFTVRVTATDKDGGTSAQATHAIRVNRGNLNPSGGESLGNTTTAGNQTAPAVSNDLFGNFVLVWVDSANDGVGNGTGVYAKVLNNTGGTIIPEFRVNTTLASNQDQPAVAMDQDGNFMLIYRSGQNGTNDIWGKLYNRFGQVVRNEFLVNSGFTADNQAQPSMAVDAAGNFVVVWQSNNQDGSGLGAYGQRFSAAGQAVGGMFAVNVTTAGNQDRPRVDMADNGSFVVTWRSAGQDGSGQGSYARRFSAAGTALDAADILVNTTTAGDQTDPIVAVDADGDFVIAWTSAAQDGSGNGIYAQRFNAAGVMQGGELLVNQTTADHQQVSQIATDSFGDFLVGWESNLQDGSLLGVYYRKFASNGAAITNEVQINTTTAGDQKALSLTANYDGDLVAAWQSADASGDGVYFQRYNFVGVGNTLPVANAGGPYTLVEGHTLSVTAAASSDANNDVLSFRWDINGDSIYGDLVGKTPSVTWAQLRALGLMNLNNFPQTFNVSVRVNDGTAVTVSSATTLTLQAYPALGGETQVNTTTAGQQEAPVIASDSAGNYVVVWESPNTTAKGVFARRYNADGTPAGAEFQVNTSYTSGDQFRPSVAMDSSGNFVILWQSFGQDGNGFGIRGRRYDNTGALQGSEFAVNATTFDNQVRPTVELAADGTFVAIWQSYGQDGDEHGIFGRRFDASNAPLTAEFQVNTFTTGFQEFPKVAMDGSGNFVVVWTSGSNQDTNGQGIFGRRYNANATPNGGEFQVNTVVLGNQFKPSVAMDAAGNFVVAWTDSLQDGNANGIFARRYDSAGTALDAAEFPVNTFNTGLQQASSVTMDSSGNFVVVWESFAQDASDFGIYARQYKFATGAVYSGEFRVNTTTTAAQTAPSVALDPSGQFVVAWTSAGQDGDQGGIYTRRFQLEVPSFARGGGRGGSRGLALQAQAVDALAARLALEMATDQESTGPLARRRPRVAARVHDAALARLLGE